MIRSRQILESVPNLVRYCTSAAQQQSTAAPSLDQLRQKLQHGPNLGDFISGQDINEYSKPAPTWKERQPKPDWMKRDVPKGESYQKIKTKLRDLKLATVCEEAKCPNIGECWNGGDGHAATATIMLMGDTCTRGCRFCSVKTSRTPPPLDPNEPQSVATAVASWGVDYIVLTSVDRDDLADGGAAHIASTVRRLKEETDGKLLVEVLSPDFGGDLKGVEQVVGGGLDVFAHNVETVPRLQRSVRDYRANWDQSINVLQHAKHSGARITKTSLMLGCGETKEEVIESLTLLRAANVDVVTFGQYMRPTKKHMPVTDFITPDAFKKYQQIAESMGFLYVASGPLVRSSYRAGEYYLAGVLKGDKSKLLTGGGGSGSGSGGGQE